MAARGVSPSRLGAAGGAPSAGGPDRASGRAAERRPGRQAGGSRSMPYADWSGPATAWRGKAVAPA